MTITLGTKKPLTIVGTLAVGVTIVTAATIACYEDRKAYAPLSSSQTAEPLNCNYTTTPPTVYESGGGAINNCSKTVYSPDNVVLHYCVTRENETGWLCKPVTNVEINVKWYIASIDYQNCRCNSYVQIGEQNQSYSDVPGMRDDDGAGNTCR